jgi:hypothetical protein
MMEPQPRGVTCSCPAEVGASAVGNVIQFGPERCHRRALSSSRASSSARSSIDTPDAFAVSVAATRDHQSEGMTPRLHHLETASAPGPAPSVASASAMALRVGQSSTTARNDSGRPVIESDIGQNGLYLKANMAADVGGEENDNAGMPAKRTDSEEARDFIARVRAARKSRYTQKQIAGILDIEQDVYKHYEKRSPLPHRYIPKFVLATGVTFEWLLAAEGAGPAVEPLEEPKRRAGRSRRRKVA